MRLDLLDEEHGHDEDGELWVRDPIRWRRADDPEPADDAPRLLLRQGAFGWHPPGPYATVQFTWGRDSPRLEINGLVWYGAYRILCETPAGRRYVEQHG